MSEAVKRERRTKIQMLEDNIAKVGNQIQSYNDKILELTAKKETFEKELEAEKAKEAEKQQKEEMKDLMKVLKTMNLTPGQAKAILEGKNTEE